MIGNILLGVGAVILVLLSVVLVHEGGHFVLAKLSGVRVDEFAVGFGPRILARQWGETTYSLRAIPAGGYVRMAGMLGLEGEADAGERNFYRAPIPRRMAVILAGIVANMVFAGLLFTVYYATPTGSHLLPGEAAQLAGLEDGAVIVSVDGQPIRHDSAVDVATDLHAATAKAAGRPMAVVYTSSGTTHTATIAPSLIIINGNPSPAASTPGATPVSPSPSPGSALPATPVPLPVGEFAVTAVDGHPVSAGDPAAVLGNGHPVVLSGFAINADGTRGATYPAVSASAIGDGAGAENRVQAAWRLGIEPSFDGEPLGRALGDGFGQIPTFVTGTFSGLYDLVTNPHSGGITGPNGLSGPVGIATQTVTQAHRGSKSLLYWIGFISMNLGLVNVLPIPFLDGGKFFFMVLEAIRRRRLDPRREAMIYAIGLALVVIFAIYVTIGDVQRSL